MYDIIIPMKNWHCDRVVTVQTYREALEFSIKLHDSEKVDIWEIKITNNNSNKNHN